MKGKWEGAAGGSRGEEGEGGYMAQNLEGS